MFVLLNWAVFLSKVSIFSQTALRNNAESYAIATQNINVKCTSSLIVIDLQQKVLTKYQRLWFVGYSFVANITGNIEETS